VPKINGYLHNIYVEVYAMNSEISVLLLY